MIRKWLKDIISKQYPDVDFDILTPPEPAMGDYSVNLAFVLAKREKNSPMNTGKSLVSEFSSKKEFSEKFQKIELVPPGFINFYLKEDFLRLALKEILKQGDKYGSSKMGKGVKINLEFVSANPTGPLTVGNARAASFGDTLGNVLKKTGHKVTKEYYINDVGAQINKLGESVRLRMREIRGESIEFAPDLYQGEYIKELAQDFVDRGISEEGVVAEAVKIMVKKAKTTLEALGVVFDEWFSESKLHKSGEVKKVLAELESRGFVVDEDGAKWLKISDDQKAVLVKNDGSTTYLANDIAYTKNKFERGFDKTINIWGADHHGDVARLKAGIEALSYDPNRLVILLHQLVALKKDGEVARMSKRKGNIETLDDLLAEVGKDAVRFFFLMKDLNTHMEFDIDLAKQQSKQNPVYYIQYAFARLNSIFEKLKVKSKKLKVEDGHLNLLKEEEELKLLRDMTKFPELIEEISENYQVHHLAQYALSLAGDFHKFYEKRHIGNDDRDLQSARLALATAVHRVLNTCLALMGISAPKKM